MFFKRTEEEIVNDALSELASSTNITQLSPGATARTLLEIVSREHGKQHDTFDFNLIQMFIRFCEGKILDLFGDMLDLPRTPSQKAFTENNNFMFYVSSGSFGNLNGGSDILVPAGTIVSTVPYDGEIVTPGLEEQPIIEYVTTQDVVCSASDSFQYVNIIAQFEGIASSVPRGVLNQHDFTNYTLSSQNSLKCTNKFSISSGQDRESDQAYRFRLSNIFKAREIGHSTSIRLSALSVPGVSYLKQINSEQGPGTFSLYVQSTTPTTSPNLLAQVSNAIQSVSPAGIKSYVLAPEPLGVEFVATVSFVSRATNQNITEAYIAMRDTVESYIGLMNMGDSLVLSDLINSMVRSSEFISYIGSEEPNSFDNVYIYRSNPFSSSPDRFEYFGEEIIPLYNERIILETNSRHRGIKFISRTV